MGFVAAGTDSFFWVVMVSSDAVALSAAVVGIWVVVAVVMGTFWELLSSLLDDEGGGVLLLILRAVVMFSISEAVIGILGEVGGVIGAVMIDACFLMLVYMINLKLS